MLLNMDTLLSIALPVVTVFALGLTSVALATGAGVWLAVRREQRRERGRYPLSWGG